jgi:hypothetical protein
LARLARRDWRRHLLVVAPETIVRWHGQGWRLVWRWRSRTRIGRARLSVEVQELIADSGARSRGQGRGGDAGRLEDEVVAATQGGSDSSDQEGESLGHAGRSKIGPTSCARHFAASLHHPLPEGQRTRR